MSRKTLRTLASWKSAVIFCPVYTLASFFSTLASRVFGEGRIASILATSFFIVSLWGRLTVSTSTMSWFPSSRTRCGTASRSTIFRVATGRSPDFI